ncbi:FAD-dependent oxidoreductase [Myxacorys almedinensis]|uniref:FAD-dependent oxidoreductase n=1 Tax=Myxacorys almedinensis A TaxID=2690445 RepID=A0A8J8CMX4_9CYAN|nr:NAD(P)/FAD-dependent oxidoreductase [Myxacorys almedinensis]NDJ17822.1 FAD-dependent oxidoreductase [Myxacorys almedinensis A]
MAVDYDLVVIGHTIAGVHAALQAAHFKARVALVQQQCQPQLSRHFALSTLTDAFEQIQRTHSLHGCDRLQENLHRDRASDVSSPAWANVNRWIDAIAQDQQEIYSPALLASAGVEVIFSTGEFCRKPQTGFVVEGRVLRSRAYLIATNHRPRIPDIAGLHAVDYLTPDSPITELPGSLAIITHALAGVELAQLYARLGTDVTLIVNQPQILPTADPEIAFLLQAALETEGVRVANGKVMQIDTVEDKKIIQIGNQTINADKVLIALGWESYLETLNLDAMNVRVPIKTNEKLQTTNSRVYYCGSFDVASAKYEAEIVVRNALFFPKYTAKYTDTAKLALTDPEIAWIGLTESHATELYGKDVIVLRRSFATVLKPQIRSKTTGLCKLIVRRNGQILGAHLVGLNAGEILSAVAIAIQHRIKLQHLPTAFPSPTASEVIGQLVSDWQAHPSRRDTVLRDCTASLLAWLRSLSK